MQEFYKDFTFILGYMVLVLMVQMAFGEKAQRGFLLTTLFSMSVLNYSKVNDFLDTKFKLTTDSTESGKE